MIGRKGQHSAARVGFTQVELLVVIGIIALLAAVLLPSVENARRSAKPAASQRQANAPASTTKSSPRAAPGDQSPPNTQSPSWGLTPESTEKRVGPATADDGAAGPAPIVIAGLGCTGDTCATAISVPSLPFSTSGNTCSCVSNYDVDCPIEDTISGGDVVYRYAPSADGCIDISLCGGGTTFDSKILLYRNVCNAPIKCNDDSCEIQSKLTNVSVTAGNTYYIVVDGYEGECGDYHLEIGPCACNVTCAPGKTAENEPNCGLPVDTVNGGCNSAPPVFTPIACGDTFCGTGAYNGANRDTDWYKLVLGVPTPLTWTVTAEFDALVGIVATGGVDTCQGVTGFRVFAFLASCTTESVSDVLPAGTWYLFVAPQFLDVVTCGAVYNAALTCDPTPEACCLPVRGCRDATPNDCQQAGGVSRGAGTRCQGDQNGDGIDEACFAPPCAQCGPGDHWIDQTPCPPGDPNVGGVCKQGGVNCLTDEDCTGYCRLDPGQNCLTRLDCRGQCQANPGQNCLEHTDCGGVCTVSGGNCVTNADCTAPGGDVCAGNVCLGRFCDNRICNKPNSMGQDTVPSGAVLGIDLSLDCLADVNMVSFGPATIGKKGPVDDATNFPGTRPIDGHKDVVDTEILAMSLTGGGITLTAGAGLGNQALSPSNGAVAEQPGNPALADSFFDVFVEVDLGGGVYVYNQRPVRVQDVITCMPPNGNYFHITGCLPLYTSPTPGQGIHVANLTSANHFTYPACCFGTRCVEPAPGFCEAEGGTLVPDCLGDGNGNDIDDACEPRCEPDATSTTRCTEFCPIDPGDEKCLPSKSGCDPHNPGSCGVLACDCINPDACRLQFNADGRPFCDGACPVPPGGECTLLGNGSFNDPYRCDCAPPTVCEPNAAGTACNQVTCPPNTEECRARCGKLNPFTGQVTVNSCDCRQFNECYLTIPKIPAGPVAGVGNPCVVPGNGGGSVDLPPAGCEYLSPDEVHKIIDGLPAGTEIHLAPIHKDFICNRGTQNQVCSFQTLVDCDEAGGSLGGEKECSESNLQLDLSVMNPPCPGPLCGYNRQITVPMGFETHTAPRTPGDPVQSFDTDMFRLFGQLPPGDPDFDLLRIVGGTDFGLPSPGHTTLTKLPGGPQWAVDSFFDITYRIDFVGAPGGPLAGRSGSTTATIRMQTGAPLRCEGGCPAGFVCEENRIVNADGTIDLCCDCKAPADCETDPTTGACRPNTCPAPEACIANCAKVTQVGGPTTVTATDCHCDDPRTCHLKVGALGAVTAGPGGPCEVVDNGSGSVDLPPVGCDYLSPDEVHKIINGLPAGTEIHLAPIHKDFICHEGQQGGVCSFPLGVDCREDGGDLGGEKECSDSTLEFQLTGTGTLTGWNRMVTIPNTSFETHIGKKKPFEPVQSFPTQMHRLFGQISNIGDPDFDLLRIVAGNDFALPSPGHTTLTQLPNGNWAVDSFFDITYRIDFVGKPGGALSGMSGSTTGTIRMQTSPAFSCRGGCNEGEVCDPKRSQNPDGTIDICCRCVPKPRLVSSIPPFTAVGVQTAPNQGTLWRSAKNTLRLTFDGALSAAPTAAQIEIVQLLDGGLFGPNVAANGFTFLLESGNTVLRIRDDDATSDLGHGKWFAIRNTGGWMAATNFEIHFPVQVGDSNGDGRTLFSDLGFINSQVPSAAADDARRDVNGDGNILFSDLGAANARVPSDLIPKPSGH